MRQCPLCSGRYDDDLDVCPDDRVPLVGSVVADKYRVDALLARGEASTLLRATQLRLDRTVALRIIPGDLPPGFASVAAAEGDAERCLRLAGAAARLRGEIGMVLPPAERVAMEGVLRGARERLGEEAADRAEAEGRATPLADAIEQAQKRAQNDE